MESVGTLSDRTSEVNRNLGYGAVPSKIRPVVAFAVSTVVWISSTQK